jgi:hypothetical protein
MPFIESILVASNFNPSIHSVIHFSIIKVLLDITAVPLTPSPHGERVGVRGV